LRPDHVSITAATGAQWLTLIAVVDDATKQLLDAELREHGESRPS
jgi:hypothetical protein